MSAETAETNVQEKEEQKVEEKAVEKKPAQDETKETVKEEPKKEEAPTPELSKKGEEILASIKEMTVMELANLVKVFEKEFGVSAAAPVAVAAQAGGSPGAEAAEEKTAFTLVLASIGDKKIQVIKEIRTITNLGLKEAKDLVDSAPKPFKEGVTKEEAEEIKKKLEAVGATVEVK